MTDSPLRSLTLYSRYVAEILDRSLVEHSTIVVWAASPYAGFTEGDVFFIKGFRLHLHEELDFDACLITSYGYEAYQNDVKLYWYDDFPHPNDPTLASSHPHHKHVPPDIKHNRIIAPEIQFDQPNLPVLIDEIDSLIQSIC